MATFMTIGCDGPGTRQLHSLSAMRDPRHRKGRLSGGAEGPA